MNTPRGYNPIGESAPGLPRHDAPLPGHVPDQQPSGSGESFQPAPGGLNPAYSGPALLGGSAKWGVRFAFFIWVYLTAPIEAALYPVAGAAGLLGAAIGYGFSRVLGGGYDQTHGWAWAGCFVGVVALMRFETNLAIRNPAYAAVRTWLRLVVAFTGMLYFCVQGDGAPASQGFVVAAITSVALYFMLRSKYLRFVWHVLQHTSWMRSSAEPLQP
jgi:hypothetical protein